MTDGTDTPVHDPSASRAASAGALLRAGREAAGLSIAAVAQQLKLAPRQVAALEDDDFDKLPGRTFIRGFVRNYARLLRLDSDAVLAALPETAATASNEQPSLAPTPRPMGELPADVHTRPSPARWAIPLALVAVVTVAAIYEITRPPAEPTKAVPVDKPVPSVVPIAPATDSAPAAAPGSTTTPLSNPLAGADESSGTAQDTATRRLDDTAPPVATTPLPVAADSPLVLSFKGTSWVEVRDGTGVLILSVTGNAGGTQEVSGRAPFDVVLGNAAAVTVTWQGNSFDTAPYVRQNVAKFTLK